MYGMTINPRGEIRFQHKGFRFILRNTPDGETVTLRAYNRGPNLWDGREEELAVHSIPVEILDEVLLAKLNEAFNTFGVLI